MTNRDLTNGSGAFSISVLTNLAPGYTVSSTNGPLQTNSQGGLVVCDYLPKGASTNIALHLQPGGGCPLDTNLLSHLVTPTYYDGCGAGYEAPTIALLTRLTAEPSVRVFEVLDPAYPQGLVAGTSNTNLTATIHLVYTNLGPGLITQQVVEQYPHRSGWTSPDQITGGGVLDPFAHTITWTTNLNTAASGSGEVVFSYHLTIGCSGPDLDQTLLTAPPYTDCQGCLRSVIGNGSISYATSSGCACPDCGGGGTNGCSYSAQVSVPLPLVETCASQPFWMMLTNIAGNYPKGWSNVTWSAALTPATNDFGLATVWIDSSDVTSYLAQTNVGGTLTVNFSGLTNHPSYSSPDKVTNGMVINWNPVVTQPGDVTQITRFNLCGGQPRVQTWTVGTSAMSVSLVPPFLGFQCGMLDIPILINQLPSPAVPPNATNGYFPDYDVDVVLVLDADNNRGTNAAVLIYVPNSTMFSGAITNALSSPTLITNNPVISADGITNTWHLGRLGVFTNGQLNVRVQISCTVDSSKKIQASLRYNNRCESTTLPQLRSAASSVQQVSTQPAFLTGSVTPSLIPINTTNSLFMVQMLNTKAAPAHNFFIQVQAPTNIVLTSANVPWDYMESLNSGTNAYWWTFTNNHAPLQGLVDDHGDGVFNDLAYNGQMSLTVTGAVSTCGNLQLFVLSGDGCLGSLCQQVGPLPVNFETFPAQAVARLDFPTSLAICGADVLHYIIRNAGQPSIFHLSPAFTLPAGVTYVPGSATASNTVTHVTRTIADPVLAGSTYQWPESLVPDFFSELPAYQDIVLSMRIAIGCEALLANGAEGSATLQYVDICQITHQTPLELSAVNIVGPVLTVSKQMFNLQDRPKHESMPGETNVFRLTIAHNASTSGSSAYRLELTDTFPSTDLQFLGASLPPDLINGSQYTWSNATLMGAIPFQTGGPFAITSAPISLVITTLTLNHCVPSVANTANLVYGCEAFACQSASGSATFTTTAQPVLSSPNNALQLNSCGGTYTVSLRNDGAVALGLLWTNFAPAGYLISGAQISGAMTNPAGASATISLAGSPAGRIAILDLTSTNITNVRALRDYDGDPATLDLGPDETITVVFSLVSDGSTLDCVLNTYPPAPAPVTTTNLVGFLNFCHGPVAVSSTYTALPDQPKPSVTITPKSLIVTNGQVQDYAITISNIGDHGGASNLQARVQFGYGWRNLEIMGVANNTAGGAIDTGLLPIATATNGLNGVLVDLGAVVLEPNETVVLTVRAQAVAAGSSLLITAEVVGACGVASPNACVTFSPTDPLAMTMPPGGDIQPITSRTIYGFYQDNSAGVGFSVSKTVRYDGEPATAAGTNRIARIGEHLLYRITAQFFDAPFTNIVVNDTLPPNLVFGTPVDAGSSYNAQPWTFDPVSGNFTLPSPVTSDAVFIVDIPVVVANGLLNQAGVSFPNTATAAFTTVVTNLPPPVSTVVSEVEPTLNVSTLVSTTPDNFAPSVAGLQANDRVYFQIIVTNGLGVNGYDLWLSNSLPAGFTAAERVSLTAVSNVFTNGVLAVGTLDPNLLNLSGNTLTIAGANALEMASNSAFVILISARLDYTVNPDQNLTDTTTIRWASMPGVEAQKRTGGLLTPDVGVNASTNNSILDNYAATSGATVSTVKDTAFGKALFSSELSTPGNNTTNAAIGELVTYNLTLTVPQGLTPSCVVTDTLPAGLAFVGVSATSLSPNVTWERPITVQTNPANTTVTGNGQLVVFDFGNVTNLNSDGSVATVVITFQAVVLDILANQAGVAWTNAASFTSPASGTTNAVSAAITVVEPTLNLSEQISTDNAAYGTAVGPLQAGDTVYYRIVVTNDTASTTTTAFDLLLTNALPAGLDNLGVYSVAAAGSGTLYTNGAVASGTTLDTSLFAVNGNVISQGASKLDLEPGASVVVVVAAKVAYTVNPNQLFTNFSTIGWSSLSGAETNRSAYNAAANERTGASNVPAPGVNNASNDSILDNYAASSSTTSFNVAAPTFVKTLAGTEVTGPGNGSSQAVIGELVSYTLTATVPQGVTPNVIIADSLHPGLAFVDVTGVSYSAGVSSANVIGLGTNGMNVTVGNTNGGTGNRVLFTLGDVTDLNDASGTPDTVAITFRAVVLDQNTIPSGPGNQAGTVLTNGAVLLDGAGDTLPSAAATVTVVEPTLWLSQQISTDNVNYGSSVSGVEGGDTLYYRLVVSNSVAMPGTTAYDLWLSNALPAGFFNAAVVSVTPSGPVYTNGVAGSGTLDPGLFGFSGNVLGVAGTNLIALQTNGVLTLVVSAQVGYGAQPNQSFTSTATIRWASLEGTTTNRSVWNPAGHERSGGILTPAVGGNASTNDSILDNYAATSGTVASTDRNTAFGKALFSSELTTPGNTTANAAIGELVTYNLTLTVPQGLTPSCVVTDTLPAGLAFVGVSATSLSPNVTWERPITVQTNPANTTVTGNGQLVVFDFGNVTNLNSDGSVATVVITFQAVVLDILANQAGVAWTNAASFTSPASGTTNVVSAAISVVEPTLNLSEQISTNNSAYGAAVGPLQAGDTVYYRIVVTNDTVSAATTAFDLLLTNALPAGLDNPEVYSVGAAGSGTLYTNGVVASGTTLDTSLFAVNGNVISQGASKLDLEPGASVVVVVTAKVAYTVNPNQTFTNFSTIGWSSLSGAETNRSAYNAAANERTGASNVPVAGVNNAGNDSILDNYAASSATTLFNIAAPTFAKNQTTELTTVNNNAASQAAIGELVTYTLTITVPQGITRGVTVVDTMDPGLAFAEVTSIAPSSGVSSANGLEGLTFPITASQANVTFANNSTGTSNKLTLTFGNITDNNAFSATPDTITVVCKAVVLDIAANVKNTTLTNNAQLTYLDGTALNALPQTVTVVEPTLTVAKLVSSTTSGFAASLTGQDYGNPVYYQIVIANGNAATDTTAYDLSLADTFGSFFTPDGTTPVYSVATNLSGGGVYIYNSGTPKTLDTTDFTVSGGVLSVTSGRQIHLEPNSTLTLVLKGSLALGVNPNMTYNNTAAIQWTSLPGTSTNRSTLNSAAHERNGSGGVDNYTAASSAVSVGIKVPSFAKTLVGTEVNDAANGNDNTHAAIGELVTYDLAVTVPEGTTPSASIVDTLDAGMTFVDVVSVTVTPNSGLGVSYNAIGTGNGGSAGTGPAFVTLASVNSGTYNKVTFDLGNVVNSNTDNVPRQIVIRFRAVVLNILANQSGTTLGNSATLSYQNGSDLPSTAATITVVEPQVFTGKEASMDGSTWSVSLAEGDYGAPLYYRIRLNNGTAALAANVDVATTANLANFTTAGSGQFTSVASPMDGVTLTAGKRVLVKNQTTPSQNGIYTVSTTTTTLVRSTDADTAAELYKGRMVKVGGGTLNNGLVFQLTSAVTTLNTDAVTWTAATAAGVGAFNVTLNDPLPSVFSGSIASVTPTGFGATTPPDANYFEIAGGVLRTKTGVSFDMPAGSSVDIVLSGSLAIGVTPSQVIDNQVTTKWTSLGDGVATGGTPIIRSIHNTASAVERTGADGFGGALNDYASLGSAQAISLSPALTKTIVATSEGHTVQNTVLADFTGTGFASVSGTWANQVTPQAQYVSIGGSATSAGSGTLDFSASPLNLTGFSSLGVVARAHSDNAATTIRLQLTDGDGTVARYDITVTTTTLPNGAPSFSYFTNSLLSPSIQTAGSTPGLDLSTIKQIVVTGNGTTAFRMDIDSIQAIRTLAVPGEIIRYRITAQVPEGTSPDMILKDTLPAGIKFLNDNSARIAFVSTSGNSVSSSANGLSSPKDVPGISGGGVAGSGDTVSSISLAVTGGSGVALADKNISSAAASNADTYNSGNAVYFRLGNVVNTASDAAAEYIVIEFNALVLNDTDASTVNGSPNQAGVNLVNTSGYYLNGNNANTLVGSASTANDFNNVVIVEPQINNLSKFINGTVPQDAGDVFTYRLHYCNDVAPTEQFAPVVDAATTADLGATFTAGQFTGAPATVDGVALVVGSRVLVKNQTAPAQNGVYRVASAGVWSRASDFNSSANITLGYRAYVNAGTVNGGLTFAQKTAGPFTVNTTALTFAKVAGNSSVKVATTANIANLGNVNLNTGFDSVANLSLGDRVLVKNQSTASQNGIYYVTTAGASGVLTRATDMDQTAEAIQGFQVYVNSGVNNGSKVFALASAVATLGTTSQTWNPVDQVTAYNLLLTDIMPTPALFQSLIVSSPDTGGAQTITTSGSYAWGSVTVPTVGTSGTISLTLNKLDPKTKISGSTKDVTVDVNATLANTTQIGSEIANTTTLKYATLPGGTGTNPNSTGSTTPTASGTATGARDGGNIASPTDNTPYNFQGLTALNNYAAGATLNLTVTKSLSLAKALTATSHTGTGATAGNDLAIGEKATYQLTTTVEEGTTADLTLTDTVPTGLQYLGSTAYFHSGVGVTATGKNSGVAYTDGTAIDPRDISNGTTGGSGGGNLVFSLINIVAPGSSGVGTKAFVVEYQLLAMNVVGNTSGHLLTNSAVAASTALGITTSASTQTATIKEPALGMTKTLITAGSDAGDTVVYDVVINNTSGTSTAYDVAVTDTLDRNLELVSPYSSRVALQGTPPSYVTLDASGNTASAVNATLSELRVGDSVTVRLTARVKATAPAYQAITNSANLTYTSLPGADANERTGAGGVNSYHTTASSANFTLAQPTVDKSFKNGAATNDATSVASSAGTNVVIGEQVTFDILVTLPEGVTRALQVLDSLPTGLRFESYEVITATGSAAHQSTLLSQDFNGTLPSLTSPPSAQNGPSTLTFNFGDTTTTADNIGANNAFVIRIVATAQNILANQETINRTNTASLTFTDPNNSQTVPVADSNPGNNPVVMIVEPTLAVTKTVDKTSADAGDTLVYTITITNSSTQLGYDTTLNDVLPGDLTSPQILTGRNFTTTGYHTPSQAATTGALGGAWDEGNGGQFTGVTVPLVVDGVTLGVNDRVLVKDEATAAHNGIYVVTVVDTAATLVRADDFKTAGQMTAGYLALVSTGGTANGGKVFRLVSSVATVNMDAVTWAYYATYSVPTAATFAITSGTLGVAAGSELYLPPNSSVVLKVSGVLANSVTPNETLTNRAYVYWGSADSSVTARRDGSDVVPPTSTTPDGSKLNNYGVASSASLNIYTHVLSGYVYVDANNDGIKQAGETPLSGVTVTLTGTDHLGNSVSLTNSTAGDGSYSFTGLRAGNYVVTRTTTPSEYLDGKETVGTTSGPSTPAFGGAVNNTADSTTITTVAIPTGNNSVGAGYNFGLIQPNSLAGVVYNDLNNNGVFNSGVDRGISGATVTLTGTDDRNSPVDVPTTTAEDGSYRFPNLRPGTYTITETQPNGYTDSTDTVGSMGGTLGNDTLSAITLAQNQNGTGYNFGEVGSGSIGDTVFIDLNNNGVADAGEGISGVTVQLQGDLNGDGTSETITAVTDASGHYLFDHLPAPTGGRNYTVTVLSGVASGLTQTVDPDGGNDATSSVTLTAASPVNLNQDFGYRGAGQIGDTVFADYNGNGSFDAGEGIPNITVTLHGDVDGDGVQETVTASTDANGNYLFTGLRTTPAGVNYTVTVDTADPDFPMGLKINSVDPDGGGDSTSSLLLKDASPINLNQDFGYAPTYSIGNRVFNDNGAGGGTVNNGHQDGSEPGIAGVAMKLYAADLSGNPTNSVLAATNTDINGYYRFDGLLLGTYVVVVDVIGSGSALEGMASSTGGSTNLTLAGDLWDHGKDAVLGHFSVLLGGVASGPVTVGHDLQPTGESVYGAGQGTNGPAGDDSDNLVVDFGFYAPGPTAAVMSWLGAYVDQGQVWVTWNTLSELDLIAFEVWRSAQTGEEELVTPDLVWADGQAIGHTYRAPDLTAVLPGQYTYRLVGWYDDGSSADLAKVKVSLAKEARVDVVRISGSEMQAEGMRVQWQGGQPPYTLEFSPQTGPDASWTPVGPAQPGETEAVVPTADGSGFFRVKGSTGQP